MNVAKLMRVVVVLASCSCAILLFSGCESVTGSTPQTLVRVIDASYKAPAVDVYAASTPIAINIGGSTITPYALLPPGTFTATVDPRGTKTPGASTSGTFMAGQEHTIFITDASKGFGATVLTDQTSPAPGGFVSLRFIQEAISTGAVDIYLIPDGSVFSDSKPLLTNVVPGTVINYINVPANTVDIVIVPTGATAPKFISSAVAFTGGQVRTLLIVDEQLINNPPVNVVIGNDLD
jgi:Domain of unknown function (DUF4397)